MNISGHELPLRSCCVFLLLASVFRLGDKWLRTWFRAGLRSMIGPYLMNAKKPTKKHKSRESYNLIINSIVLIYFLFFYDRAPYREKGCVI